MDFLKKLKTFCCCGFKQSNRLSISVMVLTLIGLIEVSISQPYRHPHRCSSRLENALDHMRRRSFQMKSGRSYIPPQSPYAVYHSIYGQRDENDDDFYHPSTDRGYYAKNINRNYQTNTRLDFDAALSSYTASSNTIKYQQEHQQQQQQHQHQPHHHYQYHHQQPQQQQHHNSHRQPHKLKVSRVDVEDLQVRLPPENTVRWVEIDKCKFSSENSTLDTRLIFPDLTLSGKIVLHPTGGKCNMILRLRRAGIEFRTVPIGFEKTGGEESRRVGAASVRTDSHFAEPGFISVFAHGCQGPTGIKLRQNSKRRYGFVNEPNADAFQQTAPQPPVPADVIFDIRSEGYIPPNVRDEDLQWTDANSQELFDPNGDNFYRRQFRSRRSANDYSDRRQGEKESLTENPYDEMNFDDDILRLSDDNFQDLIEPDARAFADIFSAGNSDKGDQMFGGQEEVSDAVRMELEKLFSMGVRSLLTTYMQRALQPAIKETLMENMGYTISYG